MTDRLSLANALAEAKIDRAAAERIATEIFDAIHDSVATKADLQASAASTKADLQALAASTKTDLQALAASTKTDSQALAASTKTDSQTLAASTNTDLQALAASTKTDLVAAVAALRGETALLEYRLLTRLGSLTVVVAGLLFAALRYLPPTH